MAPSALPPPGEVVTFPSGTAPLLGPAIADGVALAPGAAEADVVAVAPADGPAPEVEDGAPVEGAADGVAVSAASAGTST